MGQATGESNTLRALRARSVLDSPDALIVLPGSPTQWPPEGPRRVRAERSIVAWAVGSPGRDGD